jgi:V/A-type H+-transporting ATPase subunit E
MIKKSKMKNVQDAQAPGSAADDGDRKLAELQAMILRRADQERERILQEATAEADKWFETHSAQLDAAVRSIKSDAEKRAREITARQMIDAESTRDRDRLRLQNELILKALERFRNALAAFSERPDCEAILTGMAIEACAGAPREGKVKIRLCAKDASHGPAVAATTGVFFPDLGIVFDPTPAAILGGVFLYSEEGKWQVKADWKSKAEEMADVVARAVLAEL